MSETNINIEDLKREISVAFLVNANTKKPTTLIIEDLAKKIYSLASKTIDEKDEEITRKKVMYQTLLESSVEKLTEQASTIVGLQNECEKMKQLWEIQLTGNLLLTEENERLEKFHSQYSEMCERLIQESSGKSKQIAALQAENDELKEQYAIMDGRRERAIKSLEESEKQFGEQQQEIERLNGLLESYYIAYECQKHLRLDIKLTDIELEEMWNNFKSENNL